MAESSPRNCIRTSEQFWFVSPADLASSLAIFPSESMSLGAKLNAVLRLTLLIFVVLMFIGFPYALPFLLAGIAVNLGFYYSNRHRYE